MYCLPAVQIVSLIILSVLIEAREAPRLLKALDDANMGRVVVMLGRGFVKEAGF